MAATPRPRTCTDRLAREQRLLDRHASAGVALARVRSQPRGSRRGHTSKRGHASSRSRCRVFVGTAPAARPAATPRRTSSHLRGPAVTRRRRSHLVTPPRAGGHTSPAVTPRHTSEGRRSHFAGGHTSSGRPVKPTSGQKVSMRSCSSAMGCANAARMRSTCTRQVCIGALS